MVDIDTDNNEMLPGTKCRYNLANGEICPECGKASPEHAGGCEMPRLMASNRRHSRIVDDIYVALTPFHKDLEPRNETVRRVIGDLTKLRVLLNEIIDAADASQDASAFNLWVSELRSEHSTLLYGPDGK